MARKFAAILLLTIMCARLAQAETAWPGADWETTTPVDAGMEASELDKARDWLKSHNSKTGMWW